MVESFIDAKPVSYYIENKHELNKAMAMIGTKAFYRMLFYDNFIHADCHAGNIMIKLIPKNNDSESDYNNLNKFNYYKKKLSSRIMQFEDLMYDCIIEASTLGIMKIDSLKRWFFDKPKIKSTYSKKEGHHTSHQANENFINRLLSTTSEEIQVFFFLFEF